MAARASHIQADPSPQLVGIGVGSFALIAAISLLLWAAIIVVAVELF